MIYPEDEMMKLTQEQVKQLLERGHTYVLLPNGMTAKVTKDDLLFAADEIVALAEKLKSSKNTK